MTEDPGPPVVFHFSVSFAGSGSQISDAAFQEVSGLEGGLETEPLAEGGENRFVHQLPKRAKQGNLTLKRGLTDASSGLVEWCRDTIEGDFSQPIQIRDVVVSLLDTEAQPVATWAVGNAYPVKWSVNGFDATKNEIAVETIELAFTTLNRRL